MPNGSSAFVCVKNPAENVQNFDSNQLDFLIILTIEHPLDKYYLHVNIINMYSKNVNPL